MTFKIFSAVICQISQLLTGLHPISNTFSWLLFPHCFPFSWSSQLKPMQPAEPWEGHRVKYVLCRHCKNAIYFTILCIPVFAVTFLWHPGAEKQSRPSHQINRFGANTEIILRVLENVYNNQNFPGWITHRKYFWSEKFQQFPEIRVYYLVIYIYLMLSLIWTIIVAATYNPGSIFLLSLILHLHIHSGIQNEKARLIWDSTHLFFLSDL